VLDLGGSSLEAAYETPYDILDGWVEVDLVGREFRLYGRSYLQLGVNSAFERIIFETEMRSMTTNPCVPTGCILDYSDPNDGISKKLIGSASNGVCSVFVQSIIEANLPCHFPMDPNGYTECHAYGQYAPPQFDNMTFYGIDGFWDFTKELKLFKELDEKKTHTAISLPVIKKYADLLCSSTWEEVQERFPKADDDFLAQACFLGTFIYEVLTRGLGFPDDFKNFIFASKVNKHPLGWPTGLMVYQVDKMPVHCPTCDIYPVNSDVLDVQSEGVYMEGNPILPITTHVLDAQSESRVPLILIFVSTLFLIGLLIYLRATDCNKNMKARFETSQWKYTQVA